MQQVGRDGRNDPQPQLARRLALQLRNRLANAVVGLERLAGLPDHDLARLGRNDGFLRTVEQHHAQLLFEGLDLHAQRGLRHETVLGSLGKTAAVGHRQQVFELDYSHSSALFRRANI